MEKITLPNVRKFFLTDPGFIQYEADLRGADAQVVAWEAEDEDLISAFRAGLDVHNKNSEDMWGHEFTSLSGHARKAKRGESKIAIHLCLTPDHEVLTPEGWVAITAKPTIIACWTLTGTILFQPVQSWFDAETTTTFHDYNDFAFSQKITHDHKLPYKTDQAAGSGQGVFYVARSSYLPHSARLPKSGNFIGGSGSGRPDARSLEIQLLCAYQADGSKPGNKYCFHLKKQRKIDRLHMLLSKLAIPFDFVQYKDGTTNTSFYFKPMNKVLGPDIFFWSRQDRLSYIEEAHFWDGSKQESYRHKREALCSTNQDQLSWFQTLCHLTDKASQRQKFEASINNRTLWRYRPPTVSNETNRIICPETSTGFFMVRRNNVISVTGNSNYGGRATTLAQSLGWTIRDAEAFQKRWFSLHPNIPNVFHRKVREALERNRTVWNRFGFRIVYFQRMDDAFTEALAWIPQSTVALVSFLGAKRLEERYWPEQLQPLWQPRTISDLAGILLQTHDSLNFQFQIAHDPGPAALAAVLEVPIPYPDPLVIPWELKSSLKSWGEMLPCK